MNCILLILFAVIVWGCTSSSNGVEVESIGDYAQYSGPVVKIGEVIYYLDNHNIYMQNKKNMITIYREDVDDFFYNSRTGCFSYIQNSNYIEFYCDENQGVLEDFKETHLNDNEYVEYSSIYNSNQYYFLKNHIVNGKDYLKETDRYNAYKYINGVPGFDLQDPYATNSIQQVIPYYNNDFFLMWNEEVSKNSKDFSMYKYNINWESKSIEKKGLYERNFNLDIDYEVACKIGATEIDGQLLVLGYFDKEFRTYLQCVSMKSKTHVGSYIIKINPDDPEKNELIKVSKKSEYIIQITNSQIYYVIGNNLEIRDYSDQLITKVKIPSKNKQKMIYVCNVDKWIFIYGDNNKLLLKHEMK